MIVRYVTVASDVPQIENRAPSGVTTNGATFNGYLAANGVSDASVYVLWGGTNGIVSPPWAYTNWWNPGDWINGSYPSTNMTLEADREYFYRFGATNSAGTVVASNVQYLITGEVTVQPTDPTGRVTLTDTAAFTVYRPASCTNEAITVAYTLGGTATNGTHYTNSPAASGTNGMVTIPAGQTNAVITVTPLNLGAPEQTVILTLASGGYAIGAASSATCTLVAANGTYTWKVNNGLWTNAASWDPSGGPPAAGDTGIITGLTCIANANLAGGPTIEVRTNASLYCGNGAGQTFSGHTIVLNGGRWVLNSGTKGIITSSDTVALESDSEMRAGINSDDQQWILSGLIRDGLGGGKGKLTLNTTGLDVGNLGRGLLDITGTNNTYSGGTAIFSDTLVDRGPVRVFATGGLGLSNVLVSAYGYLNIGATNTTADGQTITVEDTGLVVLGIGGGGVTFNCRGHRFLLKNGASLRGRLTGTAGNIVNSYDTYALEGTTWFRNDVESQFHIHGVIADGASAGKMVVQVANGVNRYLYLRNSGNTFSGGLDIQAGGYVSITTNDAYGTGPITLLATNSYLLLDQATNADWTVTNDLAGKGMITVEAGDGVKKLTCTGTVDPGTNGVAVTTNSTGILRVDGGMAFGAGSRLKIDIAGTNGVAGVDFDRLLVDHDLTGLANAVLEVNVNTALAMDALGAQEVVVVSNATAIVGTFSSVNWNAPWNGTVTYNEPVGTVKVGFVPATKLAIVQVNGGSSPTAGVPFSVVVEAQDDGGTARNVSAATGISLTLKTGSGPLNVPLTGTIAAGTNRVTISGVIYTKAESGVALTATRTSGASLTAGDSAAFSVLHAAASQVVFTTQPSASTWVGVAFAQQPVVSIEDQFGNVVSTGADAITAVALTLTTGTGTLGGTTSMNAVAGVADFAGKGLNIDLPDANKELTATATLTGPGVVTATTDPFAVILPPQTIIRFR